MKKQNLQDERVLAQRRKINSEAYGILMIALLCSVLVQQRLLNAPFEQYAVELICFFGMSLYMIIRYLTLGLDIYGEEKRAKAFPFVNSVVTGIVITTINGVLNYTQYAEQYSFHPLECLSVDFGLAMVVPGHALRLRKGCNPRST